MNGESKKIVKQILVDLDKCTGCRACEVACSAFHARPRYSSINPARSRIQVVIDELNDVYVPVWAGDSTKAACLARTVYTIDGKEYPECGLCRASCPSRDYFKEPDSNLPLKCDLCEDDPPQKEPLCVQVCRTRALVFEEREAEPERGVKPGDVEAGLNALAKQYGWEKLMETIVRISKKA